MAKDEKKETEGKKVKKKGYFLYTLFLFIIFIITLVGGTIFLDIMGLINISKIVPTNSSLRKMPYIGKYILYSYEIHLSDEDRLRELSNKYQESLELKRRELELKEEMLKKIEADIQNKEGDLTKKKEEAKDLEDKLKKQQEEIDLLKKNYEGKLANIDKFAGVYSKMDPLSAAKMLEQVDTVVVSQILEKMEDRRIAKILENLVEINPKKSKEIIELMTKKGEEKNENKKD